MSKPREDTPVAMRMGVFPVRNADLTNSPIRKAQTGQFRICDGDLHSILTLTLSTIGVNGRAWKTPVVEEVVKPVRLGFCIDEYKGASRWHGEKQVIKALLLGRIICIDHLGF